MIDLYRNFSTRKPRHKTVIKGVWQVPVNFTCDVTDGSNVVPDVLVAECSRNLSDDEGTVDKVSPDAVPKVSDPSGVREAKSDVSHHSVFKTGCELSGVIDGILSHKTCDPSTPTDYKASASAFCGERI